VRESTDLWRVKKSAINYAHLLIKMLHQDKLNAVIKISSAKELLRNVSYVYDELRDELKQYNDHNVDKQRLIACLKSEQRDL
jgi:heme oxygenase